MNKMNIPCPFGAITGSPPLAMDPLETLGLVTGGPYTPREAGRQPGPAVITGTQGTKRGHELGASCSSESEMESEGTVN